MQRGRRLFEIEKSGFQRNGKKRKVEGKMKKKKYLAIFMAMSMATATAPVTALADDATTGKESGAETGESGSGETGSTGETGSENGGTAVAQQPDTPAENEGVKTIDELNAVITAAGETETTIKLAADITGDVVVPL